MNVLRGYVVHIPQFCIDSQWCLRTSVARYVGFMGELYEHIGVGLRRCSFRLARPFLGASGCEASDSAGLHAFFYVFA